MVFVDSPRARLRGILDRLQCQIDTRLPVPDYYGGPVVKLDTGELLAIATVTRDLLAAERDWHALPPDTTPEG